MPKEGFSVVTITQQAHDRARQRYNQKVKSEKLTKSFSKYVNDIIIEKVEADENLSLTAPFMEKIGLDGNSNYDQGQQDRAHRRSPSSWKRSGLHV